MEPNGALGLYRWIQGRFTARSPEALRAIETVGPDIVPWVESGGKALDLCCGAGAWSFFLEDHGAAVTGIDFAPYMIDLARREAEQRDSLVDFIAADVLAENLGEGRFNLAVLLGNSVADLAPADFSRLARKVHRALQPRGVFVIHYLDGVAYFDRERTRGEGVEQEEPFRITWRYKEYQPDNGAWVVTYRNEAAGDQLDYTSYMYPARLLRLLLEPCFALSRSTQHGPAAFLDVFTKVS